MPINNIDHTDESTPLNRQQIIDSLDRLIKSIDDKAVIVVLQYLRLSVLCYKQHDLKDFISNGFGLADAFITAERG
jgi:hypothetical protein